MTNHPKPLSLDKTPSIPRSLRFLTSGINRKNQDKTPARLANAYPIDHPTAMTRLLISLFTWFLKTLLKSQTDLRLENLALRQQLAVFKEKHPRPKIQNGDRLLWVALRQAWAGWINSLVIVQPDTVVKWHQQGFKLFWKRKSKPKKPGRPKISKEIQSLIKQMATENDWGAPRIHGELLKLGFEIEERTVSRYMPKKPTPPEAIKRWVTFLKNHRDVITGIDFFTVPTATFQVLYVFFVINHARRRIVHFGITPQPYAAWVVQQLREAFPFDSAPKYMIMDRDGVYGHIVPAKLKSWGMKPIRIGYKKPWQNGVSERWVLSVRNDLLNHVVVFNEAQLQRLLTEYVSYYHEDRCHLSLEKDSPHGRPVTPRPPSTARVVSLPRVGGLQHRYEWRDAA